MRRHPARRLADPFAYARAHGVRVACIPCARRWFTAQYGGRPFVLVNIQLDRQAQRIALAEALLTHPTLWPTEAQS